MYPPFLSGVLHDYVLESDTSRGSHDPQYLLAGLRRSLASRRKAFELLWRDQNWRLFILVLTETDRLLHFLWDAAVDHARPLHADCADFLRAWDACVGLVTMKRSAYFFERFYIDVFVFPKFRNRCRTNTRQGWKVFFL